MIGVRLSDLPPTSKFLALTLATWMDSDGNRARPSTTQLAAAIGRHRATVFRALKDLEAAGWLERTSGGGKGWANTYAARIPGAMEDVIEQALNGRTEATESALNRRIEGPKPSHHRDPPVARVRHQPFSSPTEPERVSPNDPETLRFLAALSPESRATWKDLLGWSEQLRLPLASLEDERTWRTDSL